MDSFCATVNENLAVRYVSDVQDIVYRRTYFQSYWSDSQNS